MKNITLIFALFCQTIVFSQVENDPCSAPCLSSSGVTAGQNPAADGASPNVNLPCGVGSTTEDNPTWYKFTPSTSTFNLGITTNNCQGGSASVQVTIYESEDFCSSVSPIGCINCQTGGSISVSVTPCKCYFIQVDGCEEDVCNFSLSYDPSSLLKDVPPPKVTGPTKVCKGAGVNYSATILGGCKPQGWTWTTQPTSASSIVASDDMAIVKWNSSGTHKICAKPKFQGCCNPPNIQTGCLIVTVDDKTQCSVTTCQDKMPYSFELLPCFQAKNQSVTSITPNSILLTNTALGTHKQSIAYQSSDGCSGINTVTYTVVKDTIGASMPIATPIALKKNICAKGSMSYYVKNLTTVPHEWSVTGGVFIGSNQGDTVSVQWNGAAPYEVCAKILRDCQPNGKSCLSVNPVAYDTVKSFHIIFLNKSIKIALRPLILQKNPTLIGNPNPSVYAFTGTTLGKFKKIIPYVVDSTGCVGYIECYIVVVKKGKIGKFQPENDDTQAIATDNTTFDTFKIKQEKWELLEDTPLVSIFPNPSEGIYNIAVGTQLPYEIEVFDLTGKSILQANNLTIIDLQSYNAGVYFLKIKQQTWSETFRLIKIY